MPPKVLAKNNDRPSGVLPVPAAARVAAAKGPAPRLKLEVRRLPPGLTLTEFEEILGEEWKLGNGKVDWREYRQGKVRRSAGKVPEQGRCYVHVMNENLVKEFEARFLAVTFQDKAGTHRSPDMKHLPPTLGFAPNQRTAITSRHRADNRQGTIDQDPEFIAFLEAETQPISRPAALDTVGVDKEVIAKIEIKSTPLIEALREKKANKAKAAESKADKKDAKSNLKSDNKDAASGRKESKEDKSKQEQKLEQTTKEAVKALNKQVVSKQQQAQQRPASPQQTTAKGGASAKSRKAVPAPKPQTAAPSQSTTETAKSGTTAPPAGPAAQRNVRPRGNAEGIKKMLQKDLGIKPKPGAAPSPARSAPSATPAPNTSTASTATNAKEKPSSAQSATVPTSTTPSKAPAAPRQQSSPANSAHKAFLKHANPSQGMTEILIQQALSQHGDVHSVTIDPRKGTAIAIFKDAESMKKAVEAKRIPVANGNVEVLEFKDRGPSGTRGGFRGGRGSARGGRAGGPNAGTASSALAPSKAAGAS